MNILQVEFKNRSGYTLRGVVTLPDTEGPVPFMVHLHGFGSNCSGYRSMNAHTSRVLAKQGIGSARFSFHGNGESDGDYENMSFDGLYADAEDIFDQDNNIKLTNVQVCGQNEYTVTITGGKNKDAKYTLNNGAVVTLSAILTTLGIEVPSEFDTMVVSNNSALTLIPIKDEDEKIIDYKVISFTDFSDEIQIAYTDKTTDDPTILTATSTQPAATEYGYFNPTTEMTNG